MIDPEMDFWKAHAGWFIGDFSNNEFADYLEDNWGREDFMTQVIVDRLRGKDQDGEEEADDPDD